VVYHAQEGPMLVEYSEAALIITWVRKVPSADNFTLTLTDGCIVVSIVYRNYQVFKDLFKIDMVFTSHFCLQASYMCMQYNHADHQYVQVRAWLIISAIS
jgi:hypothetical protein